MRAQAVEHEAEEKSRAPAAEARQTETDILGSSPAGVPAALLNASLLLRLQAGAGNAAVARLIEGKRRSRPHPTPEVPANEAPRSPTQPQIEAAPPADAAVPVTSSDGSPSEAATGETSSETNLERIANGERSSGAEPNSAGTESGVAIEQRPPPQTPDLSTTDPAAGLAKSAWLPPAQLLESLGSVSAAASHEAAASQRDLAANPPRRALVVGGQKAIASPSSSTNGQDRPPAEALKPAEAGDVSIPRSPELPRVPEMAVAAQGVPLHDPGLELRVGPLPHLPAGGNVDATALERHHQQVLGQVHREQAVEGRLAIRPLGEDQIGATAAGAVRGAVSPAAPPNGHRTAINPSEDDDAVSIIAQQEKGEEIRSAVSTATSEVTNQRQQYSERSFAERGKANAEMTQLEQANGSEQRAADAAAQREVLGLRGQWTSAQQELVSVAQGDADAKTDETLASVAQERGLAEQQAAAHYQHGQQEADQARAQAEQQAREEKKKAQPGAGGVLGAIGSAAESLFNRAKQAVQVAFDRARQVVRAAIERARQLATEVLEKARAAIVIAIRAAGTALTAIGDRVLAALPVIRDRFRRLIQDRIAAAQKTVNGLAAILRQSIQAVLNGLGSVLAAAIGLMHRGMQAAIDGVGATVRGAIDFAKAAITGLGTFAVLLKDVAANPGQWVSNLASAARDGIKNHLWPDLRESVQSWFNEKVDSVLGLGTGVWNLLKRGGVTVAQVAAVAWEGLKAMIPQTLIWVLIEKLVALIVPAAAAVMLILQALQAAWASIGRIVQAFDAFIAFLKGVRLGSAGPLFASALAKGASAVIEFASQFLLQRLMSAAGAVAGKIRALAKRIGLTLTKAAGRLVKGTSQKLTGSLAFVGTIPKKLFKAAGDKVFLAKNRGLAQRGMAWVDSNGDRCVRHGPLNPGKLTGHFESSFRSSTYTTRNLAEARDLYRVYSDPVRRFGAFWTDTRPSGPLQSRIDSALLPSYGNAATKVVHVRVPAGEIVHEGVAARQEGWLGGGTQYVLPKVQSEWEVK